MNGRNRSGRMSRHNGATTQQAISHRKRIARYDRQRAQAPYRHRLLLPLDTYHRDNYACLSVGGCF
jgi:hypothetical protein